MAGVITYECMRCGCEIIVSGADESHLRPIYCCGGEVAKISSKPQAGAKKVKRETSGKAVVKAGGTAKGRTLKKNLVLRKSSGG